MRAVLFFLIFICGLRSNAQLQGQPLIDSLTRRLVIEKNDTAVARLYKRIAEEYTNNSPAVAMRYAQDGLDHVTKMKWSKGIAVFYQTIGGIYNAKGDFDKSVELLNKAYKIQIEIKDSFNAASTLNNIGNAYLAKSVLDTAANYFFEGLKLGEAIKNNYLIASCLTNIGNVYFNQSDFDKSLQYQEKALVIYKKEENKAGMAECFTAIANTYQQKKDTFNARKYYDVAIPLFQETSNLIGLATVYSNSSNLFRNLTANLDFKLRAQNIWDNHSPAHPISIVNLGNIGLAYLDIARNDSLKNDIIPAIEHMSKSALLQKASEYLNRGIQLCRQTGDMGNYSYQLALKSEVEVAKGNFKNAYYDFLTYHNLNDSIYSQENKNKIAAMEGQREVVIRDKEIALNKVALENQRKLRWAFITGIALLLVIAALLYNQNRIRKRNNNILLSLNSKLAEANEVKAKFFGIISHDLRAPLARLVSFLQLQRNEPGIFSAEDARRHENKITASAESLLNTMETILLWSKEQMQQFKPNIREVSVDDLFNNLRTYFNGVEQIDFVYTNPDNLQILTDENYLQTIMQNLAANAVKAVASATNARIEWKAFRQENNIVLSISDNGPGISKETARVFEQKEITDNARTGFGMHLIRDLARAINCKILLDSKPGSTAFYLYPGSKS
ncbi:MAG: tetratricopeptide repeat-containing sensor histidine kinase [Gemmatimonadaceae bacterium]|nr:tetratricopeptide repeat-containing sensor histidine kinase [Chitinophagaceae bacterium]